MYLNAMKMILSFNRCRKMGLKLALNEFLYVEFRCVYFSAVFSVLTSFKRLLGIFISTI